MDSILTEKLDLEEKVKEATRISQESLNSYQVQNQQLQKLEIKIQNLQDQVFIIFYCIYSSI